ncbi:MAG: bifunctional metallophosphatase/5'-nucleotidase [Bdellovibrionales bacterium]|nr:bifunctional metallophosphatase/5'-nucleotidase [Bdellovibrionales bacterium]
MQFCRSIGLILVLVSCATKQPPGPVSEVGNFEVQTPDLAFQSQSLDHLTIAVVGINDFHGSLLPRVRKLPDGREVQSGGAPVLFSMIRRLHAEMKGNVLVIDAGDEWQGTLESNSSKGATVVDFFNRLGVHGAAIGNHEFDFDLSTLKKRAVEARYPYLASNIFYKKTKNRIKWNNVFPSRVLKIAGIRVGVIGVSTQQTPSTTRYDTVKHLEFVDPVPEILKEIGALRKSGAQAVIVTAHAGTRCEENSALRSWGLWKEGDRIGSCESEDEISRLADRMDPTLLNGIVAGHTHQPIHHFINKIPVIEGEAYNQYFNVIYLTFERENGRLLPELTRIEGLIPICSKVFDGTNHCDVRRLPKGASPALVDARFHGAPVVPSPEVEAWLKPIEESTDRFRKEVLGESGLPLFHSRDQESPFANLVADVLREKGRADFALVNSGGIRTSLDAGPITYDGLFRALPFDNILQVVELSGAELKLMFRIATSGGHGTVGISGLKIKIRALDLPAKREDLNGDGNMEVWEADRMLEIRTSSGGMIEDQKRYRLATFDFLLNGGDDLAWFMERIRSRNVQKNYSGYCRDLVSDHIRKKRKINTAEEPLVDPRNPRIVMVRE